MKRFEDKVVIITGCSKGMGAQFAVDFAEEGAKLTICARTESTLLETVEKVKAVGGVVEYVVGDVSKEETWKEIVEKSMAAYGKIDVLVNNAGKYGGSTIDKTTLEQWDEVMACDFTSCFLGMHYVVPVMREQGYGAILNMSSAVSTQHKNNPFPSVLYSAAKAGVNGLSAAVANSEAKNNIRVVALCPNSVKTNLGASSGVSPEISAMYTANAPLPPHKCEIADVSGIVRFLCSDDASVITGTSIYADCAQGCAN